jgi:hypothetical protein
MAWFSDRPGKQREPAMEPHRSRPLVQPEQDKLAGGFDGTVPAQPDRDDLVQGEVIEVHVEAQQDAAIRAPHQFLPCG